SMRSPRPGTFRGTGNLSGWSWPTRNYYQPALVDNFSEVLQDRLMTSPPLFSVIIPTYMRPQQLQDCLEGLACQNYPRDRYEVIVVDDGSPDMPEPVTTPFHARMQLRLLRAPHGGPAAARNAGAREAAGDLLAFTDDDCVPSSGWLQALAHGISCAPD